MYESIKATSNDGASWFTLADIGGRVARTLVTFWWLVLTHPVSFVVFLVRYNMLWESEGGKGLKMGAGSAILTLLTYPLYPIAALVLVLFKQLFSAPPAFSTTVFFTPPDNALAVVLWEYYKLLSPPVAQFMLNRGDSDAIAHSWFDWVTHKHFWRRHLESVGARTPRELGRWKEGADGTWGVEWFHALSGEDIVIKLKDESNGIGDAFLLNGDAKGKLPVDGAAAMGAAVLDEVAMGRFFEETQVRADCIW